MGDSTVIKVNSASSPTGTMGQKYLASGINVAMRLWDDQSTDKLEEHSRDYETVGFVIAGKAELTIEGQTIRLEPGDSWVVPKGSVHKYHIVEPFTAIEATTPPAHAHGRDEEN
jgi:quercetin dioxygenase-like cupin family protein